MIEKDRGFVLRRYNFRDTSVIASLYTMRFGKITGIFKGFYTGKREFSTPLDAYTLNEFIFYPRKREVWLVSFADILDDHGFLRKDILKNQMAALFCTLVERTMQMWDQHPKVFWLMKKCLALLENEDPYKLLNIFLLKFLTFSGFKPEFNLCLDCHSALDEEIYLSVARGGLLCPKCRKTVHDSQPISRQTTLSLLYIQKNDFPGIMRLYLTQECQEEITYLLHKFLAYHLDYDILNKLKGRKPSLSISC